MLAPGVFMPTFMLAMPPGTRRAVNATVPIITTADMTRKPASTAAMLLNMDSALKKCGLTIAIERRLLCRVLRSQLSSARTNEVSASR